MVSATIFVIVEKKTLVAVQQIKIIYFAPIVEYCRLHRTSNFCRMDEIPKQVSTNERANQFLRETNNKNIAFPSKSEEIVCVCAYLRAVAVLNRIADLFLRRNCLMSALNRALFCDVLCNIDE